MRVLKVFGIQPSNIRDITYISLGSGLEIFIFEAEWTSFSCLGDWISGHFFFGECISWSNVERMGEN